MTILVALIPALAWGSIGLISGKLGGTPTQQTLGMTAGAVLFGLLTWFIYQPQMTGKVWLSGLLSGLFWAVGQGQQFTSMKAIGISKTVPISTGLQLAGNALAGVLLFHEWKSQHMIIVGSIAVVVLIGGAAMTSLRDRANISDAASGHDDVSTGIRAIALSTVGYVLYTIIVNYANVNAEAVVLPQSIGMLTGAIIFALISHSGSDLLNKASYKNVITGLVWGTGNLFMFLSIPAVGLAISYSLAQSGIVISTFGSIFLLGEKKTSKEMVYVVIGSVLVIVGSALLGSLK
ncbi:GRP family sugar transporter [Paucilactobacillus wasatchensis]|uniref:Glucose uptake protein n=1 Tax=Paucilactobacillus wasatchensis TaxID=1335616 RepID=A0A0D0YUN7_9LACO|nr:GRP family sugar transporter [Paucilactobacillus wasatchensis]KIS02969.1 glucose uptake protein [Paucilactobacillus wasatchensis]